MMVNELPNRRFDHPMLTQDSTSSTFGGNAANVRFGQGRNASQTKRKKGEIVRNFSLSIRAHDEKALIEFPLDSVRE